VLKRRSPARIPEGRPPEVEREAIETHLDGCQSCFKLVGAAMRMGSESRPPAADEGRGPGESTRPDGPTEEEETLLPATLADGRYVIRDLLGQGGAGAVYRAYDSQLGRPIALKIVRTSKLALGMPESMQARLLREARAMARVSHPNVVAVYDVGSIGDRVFVVMELVEGRTLASWQREQARSWREVVETFMAAGVGLAAAHRVGLVHRDFKPLNVLVGFDGRVRVTDFGLARPVAQIDSNEATPSDSSHDGNSEWTLTMTGGLVGTPRYMAPEQFRAGPADARSDQYSFCVALFTALYGRHPFFPDGVKKPPLRELAQLVTAGELIEPVPDAEIPSGILEVLRRGLSSDPGQRYPSMDLLIADVTRHVAPASSARFKPRTVALAAAAALLMVSAAVWLWPRSEPHRAEAAVKPEAPPPAAVRTPDAPAEPLAPVPATSAPPSPEASAISKPTKPALARPPRRTPSKPPANPDRLKNPF
jgi:eukaryotic-like serine/threonine-protein kinase